MRKNITHCLSKHSIFSAGLILATLACLAACKKESNNDPTPTKLAGTYTLTSAKLAKDVTVDGKNIQNGKELSLAISSLLFAQLACKDKNNSAINLKDNNELYITCFGETPTNDQKAGIWTWSADDRNLKLNLAPPVVPQAFNMSIENVKIENNVLSGKGTKVLIPKSALTLIPPTNPNSPSDYTSVALNFTFQKK